VRDNQWFLKYLDVAVAQKTSTGAGVTVAVVDDGVSASHPDLAGSVLSGVDLVSGGDGRVATQLHGTLMACLIAGHGHGAGGSAGALGIAPGSRILPIKVAMTESDFSTDRIAGGIDWAVQHGARVISLSFGDSVGSDAERAAVQRAIAADVVVVASSGNKPGDHDVLFPAAYPGVLAIGAIDRSGKIADISVTGPQVALTAPGTGILGCDAASGYVTGDGTSASTAIVAGAAALVRSKYPSMSAAEVVHRLTATAKDAGPPGRDDQYGYGILNLVGALTANVPPATATTSVQPTQTGPLNSNAPTPDITNTSTTASGGGKGTAIGIAVAIGAVVVIALIIIVASARRRN
jgi:type VII secretion-associated serine protease mycosin